MIIGDCWCFETEMIDELSIDNNEQIKAVESEDLLSDFSADQNESSEEHLILAKQAIVDQNKFEVAVLKDEHDQHKRNTEYYQKKIDNWEAIYTDSEASEAEKQEAKEQLTYWKTKLVDEQSTHRNERNSQAQESRKTNRGVIYLALTASTVVLAACFPQVRKPVLNTLKSFSDKLSSVKIKG